MKEIFEKALKTFEEQFSVKLDYTGYTTEYEDDDGIGSEEYWVNDLIKSNTNGLEFRVGGWFSHDTRDDENNIYCLLALQLNGETIGDCEGIQSWYNVEYDIWDDLIWDSY